MPKATATGIVGAYGWLVYLSLGNRAPNTPRKFAYGVIGMGLAVLPMSGTTGKAIPARR